MGFICEREGSSTFIIPICSGTSDIHLKEIMPRSLYRIQSIPLYISDISVDTALKLLNEEIQIQLEEKLKM